MEEKKLLAECKHSDKCKKNTLAVFRFRLKK